MHEFHIRADFWPSVPTSIQRIHHDHHQQLTRIRLPFLCVVCGQDYPNNKSKLVATCDTLRKLDFSNSTHKKTSSLVSPLGILSCLFISETPLACKIIKSRQVLVVVLSGTKQVRSAYWIHSNPGSRHKVPWTRLTNSSNDQTRAWKILQDS